mmetsp:Transcript_29055/g.29500  ORF Transcript_29055/g.29500 Transcript_29055/m.29500 type:complete len:107 (-) Transcript_29055:319-639(-)
MRNVFFLVHSFVFYQEIDLHFFARHLGNHQFMLSLSSYQLPHAQPSTAGRSGSAAKAKRERESDIIRNQTIIKLLLYIPAYFVIVVVVVVVYTELIYFDNHHYHFS